MTRRAVEAATLDEHGAEQHPAWVLVGASRVTSSPPGAALFDSDIRHQHYVIVRVTRAARRRDLNRDWLNGRQEIVEFAMSEAQWASFVSSMNNGSGVPATLTWDATRDDPRVPDVPYEPRLAKSMDEVRGAAERAQQAVAEAFAAYNEKRTAENLRSLQYAIENMPSNIAYAADTLTEHAENVVQRARADIEAFVTQKAQQLGLDAASVGVPELGTGEETT